MKTIHFYKPYKDFIKPTEIPLNDIIHARISDSVCEQMDFGFSELTLVDGIVTGQLLIENGVYELPDFRGMNRVELAKWTSFNDNTRYHQLALP